MTTGQTRWIRTPSGDYAGRDDLDNAWLIQRDGHSAWKVYCNGVFEAECGSLYEAKIVAASEMRKEAKRGR